MEGDVGGTSSDQPIEFFVGQLFKTEEDAKTFLQKYNEQNFTELRIRSNHKKAMVVTCKHGIFRKTTSKDIRPHTRFNFVGCKAKINFYKSQVPGSTSLKVTQVNLEHNDHEVNKDVYNRANINISEEEEDLIKILADAKTKPSRIQKILLEKSNKRVTIQKLKNLVAKITPTENEDETKSKFEAFLDDVSKDGGVIEWETDADGSIKTLFITSSRMKSAFRNNSPPVVQLDTSFNFEKALYKVAAFVYLDPNTNLSEIAAFSLLSQESAASFEFILSTFAKLCVRQDLIFLIDKDFTEISSLRKIFPNSTVLLCIFHALKYIRNLVSTALVRQEQKVEIFSQFKKVLYSRTEAVFTDENKIFLALVKDVEVRSGGSYVQLETYYSNNWESSKLMWAKCFRNALPLLGDDTSNRVESSFRALKQSIEDTFVSLPKTVHAIMHLIEFADGRLKERYCGRTNRVLKIFHHNEEIRKLNEEASKELNDRGCKLFHKVLSRFEDKRKDLELIDGGVKESFSEEEHKNYKTSPTNCNCSFFANHQAPCFHIIFIRRLDSITDHNKPIFDKDIFNKRYHRNKQLINIFTEPSESENNQENVQDFAEEDVVEDVLDDEPREVPAMNDKKKYKIIMPIVSRIANLASAHGTKQFLKYVEDLETIETKIRRGSNIFKSSEPERGALDELDEEDLNNNKDDVDETVNDDSRSQSSELRKEDENLEDTVPEEETHDEESQVSESRFKHLAAKFKESVKPKGRPKKKSKQVSFNKTSIDRKTVKNKSKLKRKSVKRMDFIDDDNDKENNDGSGRSKRVRKPVKKSAHVNDDYRAVEDNDEDVSSEDSGSFKPDSDEVIESEDSDDEVTFKRSSRKPKCDKCGQNILNFCDLQECDLCFEPLHVKCFKKGGCRRCVVEDEFY